MSIIKEKMAQQKLIKVLNSFKDAFYVQEGNNKLLLEKINDLDLRVKKLENYNKDQNQDLNDSYDYL